MWFYRVTHEFLCYYKVWSNEFISRRRDDHRRGVRRDRCTRRAYFAVKCSETRFRAAKMRRSNSRNHFYNNIFNYRNILSIVLNENTDNVGIRF